MAAAIHGSSDFVVTKYASTLTQLQSHASTSSSNKESESAPNSDSLSENENTAFFLSMPIHLQRFIECNIALL